MGITKVEYLQNKVVFHIYEPTKYGEKDAYRNVKVYFDEQSIQEIPIITTEALGKIKQNSTDGSEKVEIEQFEIPLAGTIVFLKEFDDDYSSATHQLATHKVRGPYRIINPTLVVPLTSVKSDPALQKDSRGSRKILVTDIFDKKEKKATEAIWYPPKKGKEKEKCPVQLMQDTEIAVFNEIAKQDKHYHKKGTEIYMVLEGNMKIEVERKEYTLNQGDMIVVNPYTIHEVKNANTNFVCRVITVNCGGEKDKFIESIIR